MSPTTDNKDADKAKQPTQAEIDAAAREQAAKDAAAAGKHEPNLNAPPTGAGAGIVESGAELQTRDNIGPGGRPAPVSSVMDATEAVSTGPMTLFTVLIERDATTKIPEQVLGFEVEVLVEIYGEDRVYVIEEHETIPTEGFDVARAFDGLVTKYRKYDSQRSQVYANVRELAKAIGVKAPKGTAGQREQKSMSKVRRNTARA